MTSDSNRISDQEFEQFFDAARQDSGDASPDLLERVLADAYREQIVESQTESMVDQSQKKHRGMLAAVLDAIGGWPALAGLATATVAGVWIGYNPPQAFDALTTTFLEGSYGVTMDSSLPDFTYTLADG